MNANKLVDQWKQIRISFLWQLAIAFSLVALLAGGGVLLVWCAAGERRDPARDDQRRVSLCAQQLAEHYNQQGGWENVDALIIAYPCGRHRQRATDDRNVAILASTDGAIVAAGDAARLGQPLSSREKGHATPILVAGQTVGFLVEYTFNDTSTNDDSIEVGFGVGLVVVGISLVIGLYLSRRMSRPLVGLTKATQAMAAGDLDVRVPVRHHGEIRDLAIAFNRMAGQVKDTVATLRRFISDASHEIHTPLTGLGTSLELATDDKYVQRARTQVEQLQALTEGLLDLSRLEAGERAEPYPLIDLIPLIERKGEHYASWADQAGLALELALTEGPVIVHGDEVQLQRALDNLVDNAVKFTPEGGAINISLCLREEWVEISVKDTGIGILGEDLPHLFGRFHRGHNAATYPGSGLGLAIVKAIVGAHNGQVVAKSIGKGACFTLRLPAFVPRAKV